MYSFNSRVRYSELNHRKEILDCSSIINYFQDCSTFQSEDLDRGLAFLQAEHRVWMLGSWQLQIKKPAKLGDYITVGTWAYDFKGFYGYRNFIMKNESEEVLAVANSIWIYMDTLSGRPARIPSDYATTSGYGFEPAYPMEYTERKIDFPTDYETFEPFFVTKANIDSYHHVNNGQYVKLAEEYLPDDYIVQSMRVEYRSQATLGKVIIPLLSFHNNNYIISLADEQHNPYAIVEFSGRVC
ncbi:MAG: acyl-ACP thioesterase [Herbinix sp.]|jgi:acyl-ACP thioesterase|nr:acyl-ACP thioesterase [Herbinix sp.]